jgi:Fic family protein
MKYLAKKVIRHEPHYYLQFETHNKHLGNFVPENIKPQMLEFFNAIGTTKSKTLSAETADAFPHKNLQRLEEYHYWYLCLSRSELFQEQYRAFIIWFGILFSYNSNRAEGSKVTQPEIEKFILSRARTPKTKSDREIFNSIKALQFALSDHMKWNLKQVRQIHSLLLDGMEDPLIIGKWKNEENAAPGNQPTTPSKKVPAQMKILIGWLKKEMKKKQYPPLLAIEFYTRFEKIHPFLDGNGRVGRILLNAILHKFDYMPVIFLTGNHKAHCEALNQAIAGRPTKLNLHFLDQADKTNKQLKEKLKQ